MTASLRASSALRGLLCSPVLDLGPEPELASAASEIDDRSRHVDIAMLIDADRAGVRKAQDRGDAASVCEVLGVDRRRHESRLLGRVDLSDEADSLNLQTN